MAIFAPRARGLGKDNFLKLNDGEEVTGIFKGEPYTYRRHWINQRGVECEGVGTCQYCAAENQKPEKDRAFPSFRFRINFVTTKDGKWVSKIFEGGGELYDQLVKIDQKFDLSKTVVDLSRSGTKQNTKYSVLPRTDLPLSKDMAEKVAAVPTLPLTAEEAEEGVA
jgi:hypothetical protein